MDDTISRKAAIDVMNNLPKWIDEISGVSLDYSDVISALGDTEKLPSAQRWIHVSEKPIPKGLVFVTYNDGDVDLLSQPTSYRRGDIVAWMPSPEPYQEENDE